MAKLVISPISDALNGTEVKCEDEMTATMSLTTVIHVLLSADTGRLQCLKYHYELSILMVIHEFNWYLQFIAHIRIILSAS